MDRDEIRNRLTESIRYNRMYFGADDSVIVVIDIPEDIKDKSRSVKNTWNYIRKKVFPAAELVERRRTRTGDREYGFIRFRV